jgi:DNA-binding transcriptional ArsR family regulator
MRRKSQFIYIPLAWFIAAARLPGKASVVGSLLWYRAGVRQTRTVTLATDLVRQVGITRPAIRHALRTLEEAGLLRVVQRLPGRKPVVAIIEPELKHDDGGEQAADDGDDDLSQYLSPDLPLLPPRSENPFTHIRTMRIRNSALIEAEAQRDRDRRERKRRKKRTRRRIIIAPEAE